MHFASGHLTFRFIRMPSLQYVIKLDSKSYSEKKHNISNSMKKHKIQKEESEIKAKPENHTLDRQKLELLVFVFFFFSELEHGSPPVFPVSWSDVFRSSNVLRKKK